LSDLRKNVLPSFEPEIFVSDSRQRTAASVTDADILMTDQMSLEHEVTSLRSAFSKDGGADPHHSCAFFNCDFKVVSHSHR
jgi:hypothetical protein